MDPSRWVADYGDALFRFALMRVRDRAIAEDLVQETFVAALKSIAGYEQRSAEKTWLIGILKHKIIDYMRKTSREVSLQANHDDDSELLDHYFDEAGHWRAEFAEPTRPERAFEADQFWKVFQLCLDKLPEKFYKLVILREFDELSAEEICNVMEISTTNNVWVMLSRARMRMRECLGNEWL